MKKLAMMLCLFAGVTFGHPGNALAVLIDWSTGGYFQNQIGDTIGSDFDKLQVIGSSGTLNLTENISTTAVINPYVFTVGYNAGYNSGAYFSSWYQMSRWLTVESIASAISNDYRAYISSGDSLLVNDSQTITFDLGEKGLLDVTSLGFSVLDVGIGDYGGDMYATFFLHDVPDVPEPSTLLLLGIGLGGLAVYGRRKRTS